MRIKKRLLSALPQLEAISIIPVPMSTDFPRAGRRLEVLHLGRRYDASRNRRF